MVLKVLKLLLFCRMLGAKVTKAGTAFGAQFASQTSETLRLPPLKLPR